MNRTITLLEEEYHVLRVITISPWSVADALHAGDADEDIARRERLARTLIGLRFKLDQHFEKKTVKL
jgi:hypothetical protein